MLKRLFDFFASLLGLVILSPIVALIAWKVRNELGSPILFRQIRPGKDGELFEMLKFRSMRDATDNEIGHVADSERLTQFGRKLRSSSLDELPGLWNVLKGDMSLVGPRPLLVDYLPLYTSEQAKRHNVKPGITGWAQVNGRNAISWEQKFELDTWYVEKQCLWLDIKILLLTVRKVFKSEGVSPINEEIMPRFEGTTNLEDK